MRRSIKRILALASSAAIAATMITAPVTVNAEGYTPIFEGDTVIKEWKFDFGAADSAPEAGYTLVTPETNFTANNAGEYQYGFLGTDAEDYNLTDRYDGWKTQKGQVIELQAGGGTGLNDAIGVVGAGGTETEGGAGNDIFGNKADKYYPTRFALKVENNTYYRIRATVTTLDPTRDATVSLYTERKHPLYTEKTISAGTTYITDFSVRTAPIYYEKSSPSGEIADEMLTVGVLGENSAIASLEIQQVETIPTVWLLGDSTVTDGPGLLPFFPLQNFAGVGTGITKYLPRNMALVNEGEKGLTAAEYSHFNTVKKYIKAGDYMYVEYGHNHKDDGPSGYKSSLDKYYNACNEIGAKLLIVSPVQSDNKWDGTKWADRFGGDNNFEGAGRAFVEEKIEAGATNIAFVNLTKTSVEFVDDVTTKNDGKKEAAQFYYATAKGGGADVSHPNDAGAENFAYCFFKAAKEITDETQKAVVAELVNNMTDEEPNLVSAEVMAGGLGGSAWPQYIVPTAEKYPVLINDVVFNDDGTVKQVNVTTRAAEIKLDTYGAIIITIYKADGTEKGKLYAVNQVDNTGWPIEVGQQTISSFRGNTILEEGDTYSAVVVEANADVQPVDGGKTYSATYKPTDITEHLIVNERNEEKYENFDYYGATYDGESTLEAFNNWASRGSAGKTLTLGESNGTKYAKIKTDGAKDGNANQGSTYVSKELAHSIGSSGRYMVSADMKYESGNGMNVKLVTGNTAKDPWGSDSITLFSVGDNGAVTMDGKAAGTISATKFSNVQYIIDMDRGTASLSIDGGDEVTADLAAYTVTALEVAHPIFTSFMFEGNKVAISVDVANLIVAKLKNKELPKYTLTTATDNAEGATVKAALSSSTGFELEYADGNAVITAPKSDSKATLIEIKRGGDDMLESITSTPLTFTDALTKSTAVTAGRTLMLWDSLSGMAPLVPAITADNAVSTEVTAALNTVVMATATVNENYVFMGWTDAENNVVSMEPNYKFRLRDDITLTAKIVREPGVEDIADFKLDADSTFIKAAAGATTTMTLVDAVDAQKTPIGKVTNNDVTWTSSDTNVTVSDDGVVTVGSGFDMGDAITKNVTITGVLNGITKTCVITFHTYTYTEDFSAITGTWDFSADAAVGDGILTLLGNSGAGKTTEINKTLEADVAKAKKVNIKFDWKSLVAAGNGRHSNIVLMDASDKPIFGLRGQGKTGLFYSTALVTGKDGDDNFTSFDTFNNNWYTIDLTIDFELGTINGTVSETSTGQVKATITDAAIPNSASALAKIYAVNTYSAASMALDNVCIKVY